MFYLRLRRGLYLFLLAAVIRLEEVYLQETLDHLRRLHLYVLYYRNSNS